MVNLTPTMAPTQAYLDTLLLYYEEEIEGEAYFQALADVAKKPDHRNKLHLLAKVERHAASATLPLVLKYRLRPRSDAELLSSGQVQARMTNEPWESLLADMALTYPGYIEDFLRLETMAPPEDLPRLRLLTAHETVAIAFLDLEISGAPDSAAPLEAYLKEDIIWE